MSGRNLLDEAEAQHRASATLVATGVGMRRSNPELRNMGGLRATIEHGAPGYWTLLSDDPFVEYYRQGSGTIKKIERIADED